MINLRKSARNTFDNIKLSKEQDIKILNNILKSKKSPLFLKPIIIGTFVLCIGTTLGIVHANDLKETFNNLFLKKEVKEENGEKYSIVKSQSNSILKINDDANLFRLNKVEINSKLQYKIGDIEKELGINILKSSLSKNDYLTQENLELRNNKISSGVFSIENMTNELPDKITDIGTGEYYRDFTKCDMKISFKTQFYDKVSNDPMGLIAPRGTKTENYYINKLDTTAFIVKFEPNENSISKVWYVIFDYKNIKYSFTFYFRGTNPKTELKKFMDSLEI